VGASAFAPASTAFGQGHEPRFEPQPRLQDMIQPTELQQHLEPRRSIAWVPFRAAPMKKVAVPTHPAPRAQREQGRPRNDG